MPKYSIIIPCYFNEGNIPVTGKVLFENEANFPADVTKENMLTLVLPVSAQLQYTQKRGAWLYHLGAGPGLYRVWVENRRKVLKDPLNYLIILF